MIFTTIQNILQMELSEYYDVLNELKKHINHINVPQPGIIFKCGNDFLIQELVDHEKETIFIISENKSRGALGIKIEKKFTKCHKIRAHDAAPYLRIHQTIFYHSIKF